MPTKQKIIPNLWFDNQAEEAAHFYASTFKNSKVGTITRASKAGFEIHHIPEGSPMNVDFEIEGYRFIGINGGPLFKFNPSISFLVACQTREEVDTLWKKLSAGPALMDLGAYPHSERYGWLQDKYGVSWQIMLTKDRSVTQKITPTLMFVGANAGKAEEAINFYASIFRQGKVGNILRYTKGMQPDREGTVQYSNVTLEGQQFAAMDSAREHNFAFSEAISLMVECENQREIDYYWDNLVEHSGQPGVCGWLKDKYGVSWQVAPKVLGEMLRDPDKQKVERVTNAFLKMKKFNISELKRAYEGR